MKGNRIKALGVSLLGALALFLASCGQQPPPSNGGGGSGPATGTLEVTVLNANNNNPIQGATVTVTPPGGPIGTTNAQGKVSTQLTPGTYTVGASASGFTAAQQVVTVTSGQTASVTLRLQPQAAPPGPGVCVPGGDTSFAFTMAPAQGDGNVIKSIQRTNGSGEDCFVRGSVTFKVSASGAFIQIALGTTDNFQAGQVRAAGNDQVTFTLDSSTVNQGQALFVIARVDRGGTIRDQFYRIVPDNLAPELPTVRPVNKLTPDTPANRWINKTVTLTLQNPDLKDNPNAPGLLASGVKKITFKAKNISTGRVTIIGQATAYPYQVQWDTTAVPDGRYLVYAVAEDALGNVNADPNSAVSGFVVGVDNTPPQIDLRVRDRGTLDVTGDIDIFPAEDGFVSGVARVTYCAQDSGVGFASSPSGQGVGLNWGAGSQSLSPVSCTTPAFVDIDLNNVDDGPVTFVLRAKDALGNESQKSVTVTVDNNAPTLDRFLVNGQATAPSIRVPAGSQATYEVAATDPTSGVRFVRFYYAATGGATPLADGGLFQIAQVPAPTYRVVFPVFDPENLRSRSPESNLYVIAMAVDRAGNARAAYTTLKVVHTADKDNGINAAGAQINRQPVPGGVEYTVTSTAANPDDFSGVLLDGSYLYVAYYAEGSFDGAALPQDLPTGVTTTVRSLVEVKNTYPYWLFATPGLNALLFNEYGHWGDLR